MPALTNHSLVALMTVLLTAPSALFAMSLGPAAAAALALGCIGVVGVALRRPPMKDNGCLTRPVDLVRLGICIAICAGLLLYGGALNIFQATEDWLTRGAVLADIAAVGLPVTYEIEGERYFLRAPLGMYMLPAGVGRLAGLHAAHMALWIQNSLAFGVIIYLLTCLGQGMRHGALLIFSGVCVVLPIGLLMLISLPIEWAYIQRFSLDGWHPLYQFTSALVQWVWVPNHAIPGWWLAVLLLLHADQEIDPAVIVATSAPAFFWSSLVVFALPILMLPYVRALATSGSSWLAAGAALGFLPIAIYLSTGIETLPLRLGDAFKTLDLYFLFMLVLVPHLIFMATLFFRLSQARRRLALLAFGFLFVVPVFKFGVSNDIVMRASIIPLVILWFLFGDLLLGPHLPTGLQKTLGHVVATCCAASAIFLIIRQPFLPRWSISDCSVTQSTADYSQDQIHPPKGTLAISPHYHAPWISAPAWLLTDATRIRPSQPRDCWPDRQRPLNRRLSSQQ